MFTGRWERKKRTGRRDKGEQSRPESRRRKKPEEGVDRFQLLLCTLDVPVHPLPILQSPKHPMTTHLQLNRQLPYWNYQSPLGSFAISRPITWPTFAIASAFGLPPHFCHAALHGAYSIPSMDRLSPNGRRAAAGSWACYVSSQCYRVILSLQHLWISTKMPVKLIPHSHRVHFRRSGTGL